MDRRYVHKKLVDDMYNRRINNANIRTGNKFLKVVSCIVGLLIVISLLAFISLCIFGI